MVAVARPTSVDRARAAGADLVVPLGDDVDALAAVLAEAGPFDVVLDPVWGVAATAASRALAEGGRLVNLGGGSGDEATLQSSVLRSRSASVLGYTNNALTAEQRASAITAVLATPPPAGSGWRTTCIPSSRSRRCGRSTSPAAPRPAASSSPAESGKSVPIRNIHRARDAADTSTKLLHWL